MFLPLRLPLLVTLIEKARLESVELISFSRCAIDWASVVVTLFCSSFSLLPRVSRFLDHHLGGVEIKRHHAHRYQDDENQVQNRYPGGQRQFHKARDVIIKLYAETSLNRTKKSYFPRLRKYSKTVRVLIQASPELRNIPEKRRLKNEQTLRTYLPLSPVGSSVRG